MHIRWHLLFIITVFFAAIAGGATAYHVVEGWGFLDAFYFVVITVTTIGYGDLVPKSVEGKIFTMFFAFFGVATAFYILSLISSSIFKKHVGKQVSQIKQNVKKQEEVKKEFEKTVKKVVGKKKARNKKKKR